MKIALPHSPPELRNAIVDGLDAKERKRVMARCEEVELQIGRSLYKMGAPIDYVYFPLDCILSHLSPAGTPAVEAFLTGFEGMVGHVLAFGVENAPLECSVQGSGMALRMRAADFVREARRSKRLRASAASCLAYQLKQTSRNVFCVKHHEVVTRLARWLLMASDRRQSPRFDVTHKFLAAMLGTRRTGVTLAARRLSKKGLVRYRRGEMEILDRRGLEGCACECYAYGNVLHRQAFRD